LSVLLLSVVCFNRMCQENAGAKKRNQQHRTHPNTRLRAGSTINKRSAFQNDFVALEK